MFGAVVHHVLVHLVADHRNIRAAQQRRQRLHVLARPYRCCRIVRRVDHDGAGARRDECAHTFPVGPVVGKAQPRIHRHTAIQADHRFIAVVHRLEDDDLITRMHDRGERGLNGLCGARCHGDLGANIVFPAI